MWNIVLLFFCPNKLLLKAVKNGQDKSQAKDAIEEIRSSYIKSFWIIFLVCLLAIVFSFLCNCFFKFAEVHLVILRVICTALIALGVLSKLGWKIQTIDGITIPEKVNSKLFRILYVIGVFGLLTSIIIPIC